MMMTSGDFTLTGFSSDTAIANAANGTFTMSSGEVFGYGESDNGKVIISKALADFNDLKVGDEITVTNPSDIDDLHVHHRRHLQEQHVQQHQRDGPDGRHLAGRRHHRERR